MTIENSGDMLVVIRQVFEIVQYEGNCLPRLYLLVTVGMVWDAYAAHFQVDGAQTCPLCCRNILMWIRSE